jgi:hypothetical protein
MVSLANGAVPLPDGRVVHYEKQTSRDMAAIRRGLRRYVVSLTR